MEDMEKFQKAMTNIKGNFLHLISDRDILLELVEFLYGEPLKDEEYIFKITRFFGHQRFLEEHSMCTPRAQYGDRATS